ncbi:DUF4199 domain-containing protein [Allomuricauda sp. R78024]|uniref:DUF4199 domain-containing protein n=1 Tax=Allomuricauda sp. R78024 TaxID=3093867 RepID=UPI0037CAB371
MMKKAITYGLILSLVCILYFTIFNFFGISGENLVGWLSYLPYPIIIYLGLHNNKSSISTYKNKFLFGLFVSIIGALLGSLFMYFYLIHIDDLMIRTAVENQINSLDPSGVDYYETIQKIRSMVTPSFYLKFGTVSGIIIGAVISAVAPLFVNTKSL